MAVGGNQRARTFFKQHGWDEVRRVCAWAAGSMRRAGCQALASKEQASIRLRSTLYWLVVQD